MHPFEQHCTLLWQSPWGAFALAVWILIHGRLSASASQSPLAPLALVVFPVVTGIPAFLVAFVVLTILTRIRQRGQ